LAKWKFENFKHFFGAASRQVSDVSTKSRSLCKGTAKHKTNV